MKAKQSILVVDDDLAHRTMLRTLLTSWGYDVSEADDGDGAVRAVHQRPFDLVLMDIRMVRMSGIEALVEIKQYNPSLPVVLMTAYASVDTAVEAMKKGAYDYVTKPLQFEELRLTLARAMERRGFAPRIATSVAAARETLAQGAPAIYAWRVRS